MYSEIQINCYTKEIQWPKKKIKNVVVKYC